MDTVKWKYIILPEEGVSFIKSLFWFTSGLNSFGFDCNKKEQNKFHCEIQLSTDLRAKVTIKMTNYPSELDQSEIYLNQSF